jgi:hypothetical protein
MITLSFIQKTITIFIFTAAKELGNDTSTAQTV